MLAVLLVMSTHFVGKIAASESEHFIDTSFIV